MSKNKKQKTKTDATNYYHVYLNMPESEYLKLKVAAQKLGCKEVNEYLRKLLALGELTGESLSNGWEMAAFDKTKTKLIQNEKTGSAALLFGNQADVAIITDEIKTLLDIEEKIENSTASFGKSVKTNLA